MRATREQLENLKTLKDRADFLLVGKKGRKCVSHGVIVQAMANELGVQRVGFTVTKKTEASSVKRNRIKRRLRAAAADTLPQYGAVSCDFVLIGRSASATRPYETLCGDIKYCREKLGCAKTP